MAAQAFSTHSAGLDPTKLDKSGHGDPELIYEQLVSHVWECRICWPWRNQLWAVHRLCPTGAGLADRYAVAEARRGERE